MFFSKSAISKPLFLYATITFCGGQTRWPDRLGDFYEISLWHVVLFTSTFYQKKAQ